MADEIKTTKRLYKSRMDKMVDGVCGGVAEFFQVDPTLVRVAWFAAAFLNGLGLWAYIVAAIIVPPNPDHKNLKEDDKKESHSRHIVWGVILIVFGALFLAKGFYFPLCLRIPSPFHWWNFNWNLLAPLFMIILGVGYILHMLNQDKKEITEAPAQSAGDHKRIYRPVNGRMVAGVCSGIARPWNIDPTWVRIVFASIAILTQVVPMVILYIILIIVIPGPPDEPSQ